MINSIFLNLLIAIIDYITSSQLKKKCILTVLTSIGPVRILLKRTYREIN